MLPITIQYLGSLFVWIVFFSLVYIRRNWIKQKLVGLSDCYKIKFNLIVYLLIILCLVFFVLNIVMNTTIPWLDFFILLIVIGLIAPIAEEIVFRGFFIGYFKFNPIVTVFVVNVFFSLIHNFGSINPKSSIELLYTFLLGVFVSVVYLLSKKKIMYPILLHVLYNLVRMYLALV